MRIALVYVFPNIGSQAYENMARRFTDTYLEHPPGEADHDIYVVVNGGGKLTSRQEKLFDPLVPNFLYHDNSGKDLGAYRLASKTVPCDLLVCCGAPLRWRTAGWLDVIKDSYINNGPGLYGNFCFHVPAPHVRTTFFFIPPTLFNAYPYPIHDGTRYEVEHGRTSLTYWCMAKSFPVLQVTLSGVYAFENWHHVPIEQCLCLDQHHAGMGI